VYSISYFDASFLYLSAFILAITTGSFNAANTGAAESNCNKVKSIHINVVVELTRAPKIENSMNKITQTHIKSCFSKPN
jgi:hypothetical protein